MEAIQEGPPGMNPAEGSSVTAGALDDAFLAAYPRLVRLASLMVGADAEDAVMDAFLRVRSMHRQIDNPTAYIRSSVVNECRSRWRTAIRRPRLVVLPDGPDLGRNRGHEGAEGPDVDTIWSVVVTLPADQRAVVALRFYEDFSIPQIASALDMPEGTVKSHLHRAIRSLRTRIGDAR